METANFIVRRIFAWPLVLVGAFLVTIGGDLIRLGAWVIDLDVSDID